jgi:hypothetical protein
LDGIALSTGTGRAGADSESMASKCRRHASSSRRYTTVTHQGGALALLHVTDRLRDLLVITELLTVFDCYDSGAAALPASRRRRSTT